MTTTTTLPYEVVSADTTQISRSDWLSLRKDGLGSSDVAGAMGMSHYCSPYSIYCEKNNLVPEHEQTPFFEFKLALEPVVLDWAEGREWVHGPIKRHMMLRSVEHPFLTSNPDGFTDREVVEVKCLHSMDESRWDEGAPDMYVLQCHVHMIVTGLRECLLAVMFGNNPPQEFWITYDPVVAAAIIASAALFWQQVQDGVEPDPDSSEATMLALRERYYAPSEKGTATDLGDDALDLIRLRNTAVDIIKSNEEIIDGVKANLMSRLGKADADIGKVGDDVVCTWNVSEKTGKRSLLFKNLKESA